MIKRNKLKYKVGDAVIIDNMYFVNSSEVLSGVAVIISIDKDGHLLPDRETNTYRFLPIYEIMLCGKENNTYKLQEWMIKGKI
jgi:hypothetical protein